LTDAESSNIFGGMSGGRGRGGGATVWIGAARQSKPAAQNRLKRVSTGWEGNASSSWKHAKKSSWGYIRNLKSLRQYKGRRTRSQWVKATQRRKSCRSSWINQGHARWIRELAARSSCPMNTELWSGRVCSKRYM
jgi:hypothetical protein